MIAIISFALGAFIYNYFPVIFQEGNPWPQIKGVAQLTFGGSDMVKLSSSDNSYLTKSQGGLEAVDGLLRARGYEFVEQMGSGYFYGSSESNTILVGRQYSRFYTIWTLSEAQPVSRDRSLADELEDCLPKSDMGSLEKCNELLATVDDFTDCVDAGFPIMKSNPPQCTTPAGQIFIENGQ